VSDRFDEMAQEFCIEHNLAVDGALAAFLRKVHDEAANRAAHLTAQLAHAEADAEQAIHNEAFKEAQRIAEWLRTTSRAKGVLISIHASQDIARLADDVASMSYREPT
jgi:peptidyl-tRNA hydrolase